MPAEIRGPVVRSVLAAVEALAECERVLAAVDSESVRAIRDSGIMSYVEMRHSMALYRGVEVVLGQAAVSRVARDAALRSVATPLLEPIRRGATRLGVGPAGLLRAMPTAQLTVMRQGGHMEVALARASARVVMTQLPDAALSDTWIRTMEGSFLAVVWLGGSEGRVVSDASGLSDRHAAFDVDWA